MWSGFFASLRRCRRGSGVLAMVLATLTAPALANDAVFTVARVPVVAQADSAIAAKQEAEDVGRRKAMDILLRRLAPRREWQYLPRLEAGEAAGLSDGFGPGDRAAITLDDQQLLDLEQSFEVFDEKSGPTTYRAMITYRFKPVETRNLLIAARIPYSEAQARKALVLPVLETDRGLYLWESNNPWLKAWQERPLSHELTPIIAPLGDLEDSTTLSAEQAKALDTDRLAIMADRYGVSQVIIAHARLRQEAGTDKLRVRLINGFRESGSLNANSEIFSQEQAVSGIAARAEQYLADGDRYTLEEGRSGISDSYIANGLIAGNTGDTLSDTSFSEPSGNFPTLADTAVMGSVLDYASGWKAQTLIDHSRKSVLRASAFFKSVEEWKRIRLALISTPLVGSVQIRNLSREGAEMSIETFGDPGKLVVAMENQGLSLWTLDEGPIDRAVWNIATPATAARIPVRVQRAHFDTMGSLRQRTDFVPGDRENSMAAPSLTGPAFEFDSQTQSPDSSDALTPKTRSPFLGERQEPQ